MDNLRDTGQICYGIAFRWGVEFPWDKNGFEGNIDDWWVYGILGFQHSALLSIS